MKPLSQTSTISRDLHPGLALTGSLSKNSFSLLAAHPFMGKTSAQRGETDTGLLPPQTHWGLCELGRQGRKWRRLPRTPSSVSASTGQAAQDTLAAGTEAEGPWARCQRVGKKLLAQKQTDFGSSRDVRATEPISVRTSLRSYKPWLVEERPLHHH